MRDAGHPSGDELDFIASDLDAEEEAGEINVFGGLWTSRVTSHLPLSKVAEHITRPNVERSIRLVSAAMRRARITTPRIAVAGLNPHAGENGLFGREEIDVIAPAIEALKAEGELVAGPFPPDTVFPSARKAGMNAIVTMYHDQGQIALKAVGLGKSVTILAGLDIPIATPGHGTAYDIVGQGVADMEGIRSALALCRSLM
jgi:4-hydroxythreonine-4-phosphate dehydrogenase